MWRGKDLHKSAVAYIIVDMAGSMIMVTSNAREYLAALGAIPGAMQEVTAATLTETAQAVTRRSERNVRREMIVRAAYTTKSLITYKASAAKPIARQNAISGTKSDYLPIQDKGGVIHARKARIAVPTNAVRGADRKKRVPTRYRIGNMKGAFVLRPAAGTLERPGIFVRRGRRLVKVRDLGSSSYKLKATLWHSEAVKKYGTYQYEAGVFRRQAQRRLSGYVAR